MARFWKNGTFAFDTDNGIGFTIGSKTRIDLEYSAWLLVPNTPDEYYDTLSAATLRDLKLTQAKEKRDNALFSTNAEVIEALELSDSIDAGTVTARASIRTEYSDNVTAITAIYDGILLEPATHTKQDLWEYEV